MNGWEFKHWSNQRTNKTLTIEQFRLWIDLELNQETKEETLNNSNVNLSISLNYPRVDTKERWEKLKHIERKI